MTASFTVQDDNGTVVDANAYISAQEFKDYHDSRGNSYTNTDALIQKAIVKATDYLDGRFNFVGFRRYSDQTTAWPRWDAIDITDRFLRGIPDPIKHATAEYALRAMTATLAPDPTYDASGRGLSKVRKKVGPIETDKTFSGAFVMPIYPAADRKLYQWGLVVRGATSVRA